MIVHTSQDYSPQEMSDINPGESYCHEQTNPAPVKPDEKDGTVISCVPQQFIISAELMLQLVLMKEVQPVSSRVIKMKCARYCSH